MAAKTRDAIKKELVENCKKLGYLKKPLVFTCERQFQTISPKCQIIVDSEIFNLRYCKKYNSIFEDEQPVEDNVVLEQISIDDFVLMTRPNDIMLKMYLLLNPANKGNGGVLYRLEDKEKEAKAEYDIFEKKDTAVKLIRDSDITNCKAALFVITKSDVLDMESIECRLSLRKLADNNPDLVINAFEREDTKIIYRYRTLVRLGHIIENSDSIEWGTGEVISQIMYGQNACDIFVALYNDKVKGEFIRTNTEKLFKDDKK